MEPTKFILEQGGGPLTSLAGLTLVGNALHRFAQVPQLTDPALPVRSGIPNSDILMAMMGLLCQGKSDFEAIERFRQDAFYARALGLRGVPSSATLRQRLDRHADDFLPIADTALTRLLQRARVPITPLDCGYVPLDLDVFTLDNSNTKKEGIGWTYAGFVGYAPIAAYLGQEGWNIGMELREGTQHSAEATDETLDRVLPRALSLTKQSLLVRMDAGFHSKTIAATLARYAQAHREQGADLAFLIKWNRRGHDLDRLIADRLDTPEIRWESPRPGKRVTLWESLQTLGTVPVRRILRLTERTTLANGQHLLMPEYTLEGWTRHCPRASTHRPSSRSTPIMPPTSNSMPRSRPTWIWSVCLRGSLPPTISFSPWVPWPTTFCA